MSFPRPREHEIALVTGASSGTGRAFALQLAREGWPLMICARRGELLLQLKEEIAGFTDASVMVYQGDISRRSEVDALMQLLQQIDARVAVLINSAGMGMQELRLKEIEGLSRQLMELNFSTPQAFCRGLLPGMLKRRRGWILNVASVSALNPLPGHAMYSASKSALLAFGRSLSIELKGTGVQLLSLCPGFVKGQFFEAAGIDFQPVLALECSDVAKQGLEALFSGRHCLILSASGGFRHRLFTMLPLRLQQLLLTRWTRKLPPTRPRPAPPKSLAEEEIELEISAEESAENS